MVREPLKILQQIIARCLRYGWSFWDVLYGRVKVNNKDTKITKMNLSPIPFL